MTRLQKSLSEKLAAINRLPAASGVSGWDGTRRLTAFDSPGKSLGTGKFQEHEPMVDLMRIANDLESATLVKPLCSLVVLVNVKHELVVLK